MSAEKLITDHIDIWTSAVQAKSSSGRGCSKKRELYGIKKLRELILELAVRGKLVSQDPNDEPASVLLERIAAEKAQLVKEGKIKKESSSKALAENGLPFSIPNNWRWERLPNITFFQEGPGILAKDFRDTGVPLIRIAGMHQEMLSLEGCNYLDEEMVSDKWDHFRLKHGDIVISSSASLGKVAKVGKDTVGSIVYTGLIRFRPYSNVSYDYIAKFFASPEFNRQIGNNSRGAAIKHFGPTHLKTMIFPLPPVEEQHRIVAKVDELMALCDQLEQQTEASLDAHQVLVETLLATLTNSQDATELMVNWARISEHFDTLFTTEQSIDQLKQTILQLAVMGKLVPQDPNDEPAAKLLERIAEEKAQLVKEKKIKKQKALPPIADEEKPFELPNGWAIERLGNLTQKLGSGSTPRGGQSAYISGGIPFLRSQNVWNDGLKMDDIAFIKQETHDKMENTKVFPDDILLNITGASLGRSTIFPAELVEANVSQHVTIIRLVNSEMNEFVHLGILSPMIQKLVWERQVGMAIEGLSKKVLEQFEFPVPPLKEQKKIVSKVAQLYVICDQLKQRLRDSQQTQLLLTDAIVGKFVDTSAKKTNMPKDKSSEMMISTILSTTNVSPDNNSPIALMVEQEGGKADAKEIWSKTKYSLPDFYKQLKKEIEAGYIEMPSPASTNN
ncbi:restriction endonuclease subunit S [Vibrio cholerae]|nr:restriction endonuclease subunit S [Vibrio cholerae]EJL6667066.1 restriction endonuclease subunit S [Vibrio cholerae]ELY5262326.1 restriction endonuclease subunit S [Vibrio cholerae]